MIRLNAAICNQIMTQPVQTSNRMVRVFRWTACLAAVLAMQSPMAASTGSLESAESAVKQMQAGELRAAAVTVRQALDAEPGNLLLHNLAGALLTLTGDTHGALTEWGYSLNEMPDDALARYGMGMSWLTLGEKEKSLDYILLAQQGGDTAACLVARRYVEMLNGAEGAGSALSVPDEYAPAAMGMSGINAWRRGDQKTAFAELTGALNILPGDPYHETTGLAMTFDPRGPIRFGSNRLPTGNGLATSRTAREKPRSGTIILTAGDVGSDAGFVMFKIDSGISSVANTPPFKLVWDTSQFPNGLHRVEVLVFDRQGRQTDRSVKEIRTANSGAPRRDSADAQREEQVRSALWRMLALRPSRSALAYTAAMCAHAAGNANAILPLLQQTVAVQPEYKDARVRLASLTGIGAEAALWRGDASEKVIALTFDDGPKPGVTEQLLAALTSQSVPATFFVIGRHAAANPELVRKIANAGMQVENHTYSHPNLTLLPPAEVERELLGTMAAIQSVTGKQSRFYRPPGGNMNSEVSRIAAHWGLTPCMWTLDGEALENGSPARLIDFVVKKATPGAIVLLHNGRMTTIEALPKIIEGLRKRGFTFVTIDQLAAQKAAGAQHVATPLRPGGLQ